MQFLARKYKSLRVVLDPISFREVAGKRVLIGLNGDFKLGYSAQFKDGKFETKDPAIIKALKSNQGYGFEYSALEVAPEPTPEAKITRTEKKVVAAQVANTNKEID
jgi:hypothetical protein